MVDIPDKLKGLITYLGMDKAFFSGIQLVNLKITSVQTFEELGYLIPPESRIEFDAAIKKGFVTVPVIYGKAKNEVYDIDSKFVCSLIEK